jgi:hypothetical protein
MSGLHLAPRLVVCVRDEDAKTFAFHTTTRDDAYCGKLPTGGGEKEDARRPSASEQSSGGGRVAHAPFLAFRFRGPPLIARGTKEDAHPRPRLAATVGRLRCSRKPGLLRR